MDLNRFVALGCCSWHFNKICSKCAQPLTGYKYCQSCSSKEFESRFDQWTSENRDIDDFIQRSQLTAINKQSYLLWIPFDDLINVKYLSKGGFASVYHAKWDHFQADQMVEVVLKRLHNGELSNPEFLKEQVSIYLYGAANNSNILRCYGFTKHPTEGYMLVLEFAEDGDLRSFLQTTSPLLWSDKFLILRDISKSLALLHSREFIHGDLHTGNVLKKYQRKKSNILKKSKKMSKKCIYDPNPNARETIIDIPLYFNSNSSSARPYGVIPYVAPEVFEKGYHTKQSDIYSFGMVLWELAMNQSPFSTYTDDKKLVYDIVDGVRPKVDGQSIPECVVGLIEKCWDPDPLHRPSANTVKSIIDEWILISFTSKIRLSKRSKEILNQFSSANNKTIERIKHQSQLLLGYSSLSRSSTIFGNNRYYSRSLSGYLTTVDVEKSANATPFSSSTVSVNSSNYNFEMREKEPSGGVFKENL